MINESSNTDFPRGAKLQRGHANVVITKMIDGENMFKS